MRSRGKSQDGNVRSTDNDKRGPFAILPRLWNAVPSALLDVSPRPAFSHRLIHIGILLDIKSSVTHLSLDTNSTLTAGHVCSLSFGLRNSERVD